MNFCLERSLRLSDLAPLKFCQCSIRAAFVQLNEVALQLLFHPQSGTIAAIKIIKKCPVSKNSRFLHLSLKPG
jgi:hypothetical protein